MGINNLLLSPELIASLYPEALLAGKNPESIGKMADLTGQSVPVLPFLGQNLRSVCVVTDYPDVDFLPDEQLGFIQKILLACKYRIEDIALVNAGRFPLQFADLKKQFQPRTMILWGTRPGAIGLEAGLPEFSISRVDEVSVMPVFSPELMVAETTEAVEMKKRLWACLQKLFVL
jgi:hypothetical protein